MSDKSEQRVIEAIEAIRNGEMVIMIDDEDRENEGDLVYAAAFSTPEKVNFLTKEARGLICVAVEKTRAKELELEPMVKSNTSNHETAFTISIDATNCTTGISSPERDMTIKLMADPATKPEDFVKPGHIFPLTAKNGGVLVRTGHTEGSVDLCKLAGIAGVGVICEIIKEDGEMARRDDLEIFGAKHNLKTVFIADLIDYRLKRESLIALSKPEKSSFLDVFCHKILATDHQQRSHSIYQFGAIQSGCPVKFHVVGRDIDFLQDTHQFNGMVGAVHYLQKNGGVLIFMDVQNDEDSAQKDYGLGAQILKSLGVTDFRLITTKKVKDFVAMSGFGLEMQAEIVID